MKRNVGYLYLLITFFCWGSIYVVSKYALVLDDGVLMESFATLS